jgi:hypothetical protein
MTTEADSLRDGGKRSWLDDMTEDEYMYLVENIDVVPIWLRLPPESLTARELVAALPPTSDLSVYVPVLEGEDAEIYTDEYDHLIDATQDAENRFDDFVVYNADEPSTFTHVTRDHAGRNGQPNAWLRNEVKRRDRGTRVANEVGDKFFSQPSDGDVCVVEVGCNTMSSSSYAFSTGVTFDFDENNDTRAYSEGRRNHGIGEVSDLRLELAAVAERENASVRVYDADLAALLDDHYESKEEGLGELFG